MKEIDMGTDHLKALKGEGLGKIIMNRPEARNAMSDEMNAAMMATLEDFENDSEVRAVILTGSEGPFYLPYLLHLRRHKKHLQNL